MLKNFALAGRISGVLGALICLVAGLTRIAGMYYVAGFQSTTLFNVGIGLMVFACMMRLEALGNPD
ncbi:MAG: hypothetical protein HKN19_11935 [Halioglobus sp.]|nr:hypothetical protein [Halioglobus sp.]